MNPPNDNYKNGVTQEGAAQAAILSIMVGVLTLAFINLGTEVSDGFKETIHQLGKLWMPGAEGIGPYSGKETLSLLAWLISWALLHILLRKRELNHRLVLVIFLFGVALATTLIWPPVYTGLAHFVINKGQ